MTTTPRPLPAAHRVLLRSRRADPTRVGAIAPTGRRAATAMAEAVPPGGLATVLELGAGTGAITCVLRERARRVIAVESDPNLVEHLREAVTGVNPVHADARDLDRVLDEVGVHRVDAVISSLPLTLMPSHIRRTILAAAARRLAEGGRLVAVTYRPAGSARSRELIRDMSDHFARVTTAGPIWTNLPPARLVHGREPLRTPRTGTTLT